MCADQLPGFVGWAGLNIVAMYGRPDSLTPQVVKELVDKGRGARVTLIIDNMQSGKDAGAGIAEELGCKPLASFVSYVTSAVDPAYMGIGPVVSVPMALKKAGLKLDEIDLIEHNEAFACIVIACRKELGYDLEKLNIHGGAIALGHPTGSSGSRIATPMTRR